MRVPWSEQPIMDDEGHTIARVVVFDESSEEARRATRLRRQAVALEREADDIIPVEERTWLR